MFNDILNIINSGDPANYEQARLILDNNPDLVNTRDNEKNTLLHRAVRIGNVEIAELLLSRGADVNVRGHRGNTPLYYAAEVGDLEIGRLLLDRGADINAPGYYMNYTPLNIASLKRNLEFTKFLLERGASVDAARSCSIHNTIRRTDNQSINQLLIKYTLIQDNLAKYPFSELDLTECRHYDELHGDELTRRINEALNRENEAERNVELTGINVKLNSNQ